MGSALAQHWPEYAMEAAELGMFMLLACAIVSIVEYPGWSLRQLIGDPTLRRGLEGIGMGATAIAIIYSPLGRQSGAHFNPAVTLTFWRLGRIHRWDALFYVVAQFAGGVGGVLLARALFGQAIGSRDVNYIVTIPHERGAILAFAVELLISFGLMTMVLQLNGRPRWAPFTGLGAGMLIAVYILVFAPVSGMSMNPARTTASAVWANVWTGLWIYFVAPPLGMLVAAELFVRVRGRHMVRCGKLLHDHDRRCIFQSLHSAGRA
jgi:aquaporin Z